MGNWKLVSAKDYCMPGIHYAKGSQLYSDMGSLEKDLLCELLRNKVYVEIDRNSIFEYKADISSGFLGDLEEFIGKVSQENISFVIGK